MKKLLIGLITQIQRIRLLSKKVVIRAHCSVYGKTIFEGNNIINNNCKIKDTEVGRGTYIGRNCNLTGVVIGKYCSIGTNISVIQGNHPKHYVSTHPAFFSTACQAGFTFVEENKFEEYIYIDKQKKVSAKIGNDVWIGNDVRIMAGVTVGDGAIIGAGALITKNIEPYSINVGIPGKVVGYRFDSEDIEWLLRTKWWNMDINLLNEYADAFDNIDTLRKRFKEMN
jgi:acetyltransferase-like isoleucine patch superfamily enzyme